MWRRTEKFTPRTGRKWMELSLLIEDNSFSVWSLVACYGPLYYYFLTTWLSVGKHALVINIAEKGGGGHTKQNPDVFFYMKNPMSNLYSNWKRRVFFVENCMFRLFTICIIQLPPMRRGVFVVVIMWLLNL